ncbi:MAG: PAS domain S-box protein [Chloroflexota bacterium]|nr:PAS domain S-box protein [Chloroflexota bacterium]
MKQAIHPPVERYGVAIVSSLIAIAITQLTVLQTGSPFLLAVAAILISTWYGGLGPGLVATAITLLANIYFILGPTFPLRIATVDEVVRLGVFAFIGLLVNWLTVLRERTEERLREQRGLLSVTLSSIGDAVVTTDEQGLVSFMNPVAQSLTGWKLEDVAGKPVTDVIHVVDEKNGNPIENPASRVLREGAIVELENHSALIAADGKRVPVGNSAAPIRDDKGNLVGVILVFRDITERRRAEDALRESQSRLNGIVLSAMDAIITIDAHQRILLFNAAAEMIFRYPASEAIGQPIDRFIPERFRDAHREHVQAFGATGVTNRSMGTLGTLIGLRADGEEFPIEASISQIQVAGSKIYTAILRDITERKQAERRQAAQHAVTRALAESDTLSEATPKILQAVCESAGWQVGAMWGIDHTVDLLRCVDVWHVPDARVEEFEALTREMLFAPGVGLPGRVWTSRSPSWISDVTQDANFPRGKVAAKNNLHGAFGFPILSDDEFTGVIEFFSPQVRPPDEAFLQMMSALGSQIGQFLERKKAEEALNLSREQQAIILQGVADGITAQDLKGRLIYANDAAARLIGYASPQALLDTPVSEVMRNFVVMDETGQPLPPERLPGRQALEGKQPETTLVRFRVLKTGEERWSLVSAAPVRDERGQVRFAVNIFHDVTERRRAEEERARLAAIVESSEDAIVRKTVDGIIQSWNPGATRLYGYSAEEAIGKSISMLYPPERLDEFHAITERLKRDEPTALHDTERIRKDGSRINVSASISLIKDSAGRVTGASTIARDFTERKRAEESQRFLAEASSVLASSLDYGETLASVARLAVPKIADWCGVEILQDDNVLEQVAVAHVDPEKVKLAEEMQRRYPPDPNAPHGVHNVLRTGKSEFAARVTDEQIAAAARDVDHLKMLVEIGLKSYIIAPLIARGRTLGAITFVSSQSGRHYGPADVALAEELARRAALSVDNARLYQDAQRLNEELEQRVISRTIELQNTNRDLEAEINERQQANEQLRLLSAHLQSAREEERIRIAREIHDELGQVLTAIKIDVSLLGEQLEDKTAKVQRDTWAEETKSTIQLIDETIQKMRRIVRELRPEILDHLGLSAAIEWQMQEFQSRTGIKCQFRSEVDDSHLDLNRSTAVFRILQEALTNVARHAGATSVEITLKEAEGRFILEVRDNGRGITADELAGQKSFGILGMRERALAFGGEVSVRGAPSHGTIVTAQIPI